jgi:hypothetical protein
MNPTEARTYVSGEGRAKFIGLLGLIAKHLFVITFWCHRIMHLIIGVPIKYSASFIMGHAL